MMSTGYLDAFAGLSGDMMAGALIDCGAAFSELERVAAGSGLAAIGSRLRRKDVSGIAAAKFEVEVFERQPERHFGEIRRMIEQAGLKPRVERHGGRDFRDIGDCRGKSPSHDSRRGPFP